MVGALTLVTSLLLGPIPVWRSVGSNPGALDQGGASVLSIASNGSDTIATFTLPVNDRVGVGDVIQYDSDGDGAVDALAFIVSRRSAFSYVVHDTSYNQATQVAATTRWAIFRAYLSLGAALNTHPSGTETGGSENPALDASLRDFDTFTGGKDLPGNSERWMVACYDDGPPDDTLVWIDAPWVTDQGHRIEIFTPVNADEVGTSQRHDGTWGTGYRRTHALHIVDRDVYVTGLSIQQSRVLGPPGDPNYDNRVFMVHTGQKGSDIEISHCYGEQTDSTSGAWARVFDVFDDDLPYGTAQTQVLMWNDLGVTQSTSTDSAAFISNSRDDLYLYACTGVAPNGAAAFLGGNDNGAVKAAVVKNALGWAPGGLAVRLVAGSPPMAISTSAVNDSTIDVTTSTTADAGNVLGAVFTFADAGDYHLSAHDTGARGLGADLYPDPVLSFTDDLDGHPRTPPWDVGACQYTDPQAPSGGMSVAPQWPDSAVFQGAVYPNTFETRAWFRYDVQDLAPASCDDTFGTRVPATGSIACGSVDNPYDFDWTVGGLTPGGTYSACLITTNAGGTSFSSMVTFTVSPPDAGEPDAGGTGGGGGGGAAGGGAGTGGGVGGGGSGLGPSRNLLVGCSAQPAGAPALVALGLLALMARRRRAAARGRSAPSAPARRR